MSSLDHLSATSKLFFSVFYYVLPLDDVDAVFIDLPTVFGEDYQFYLYWEKVIVQ